MQLIINTYGSSVRRKGERFLIKNGEKQVDFSAHKVQTIVIATGTHFSSNAIQLACQHNIDVVFLDKRGDPTARVWQTKMGSTAAIRRRQLEVSDTSEAIVFVREWTISKLSNQLNFLSELRQRRPNEAKHFESPIRTIEDARSKVNRLEGTIEEIRGSLMGLEGSAGRAYFDCLTCLMPEEYRFNGRSRRPAVDPFNSMLNYAYGVLYSLVERSLILAGLDPFVGFLHTDNYNKKSLVFDMIEPFRIIAERTTVLIFTGRRAKREFFREVPGGIELAPDGRAYLITELNKRLDRSVRYPVGGSKSQTQNANAEASSESESKGPIPSDSASEETRESSAEQDESSPKKKKKAKFRRIKQRVVIQYEAHALANSLLGRKDIPKVVETKDLWSENNE